MLKSYSKNTMHSSSAIKFKQDLVEQANSFVQTTIMSDPTWSCSERLFLEASCPSPQYSVIALSWTISSQENTDPPTEATLLVA